MPNIWEYRGVEGLVCAEVTTDTDATFATGTPFAIAGVAEIGKQTTTNSETHYYDNIPAIVINSTGSDTVTISTSGIPLDVVGRITGQKWDATKGALYEGIRDHKYWAIGYKTKKTDGTEMYVWRLKGTFAVPDENSNTEDDTASANGQELVYTGISTTHKFTNNNNKPCKSVVVDSGLGLTDVSSFFDAVQTPDSLTPNSAL